MPIMSIIPHHRHRPIVHRTGLHPNAEIGFLTSKAESLFQIVLRLEMGASAGTTSDSSAGGGSIVRDTLQDLIRRLPSDFELISLAERCKLRVADWDGPYVVVVMQECSRLNALMAEMRATMDELQKGLNGQLNMSQGMEDMAECLGINQVPGRNPFHACSWERLAWASRKSLSSWFSDLLLRKVQSACSYSELRTLDILHSEFLLPPTPGSALLTTALALLFLPNCV